MSEQSQQSPSPQEGTAPESPAENSEPPQDPSQSQESPQESPQARSSEDISREKLARQHRALNRRIAAAEAQERAIAEREARLEKLSEKEKQIAEWDELDEWQTLERVAKKRGIPEADLIRRAIARLSNGGKPAVEHEAEDAKAEARRAREELAAFKRELEEREERQRTEAQLRQSTRLLDDYRAQAAAALSEEAYPVLSAYDPNEVAEAALRTANAYAERTGEIADVAEVLEYLEAEERKRLEPLLPRLAPKNGTAAKQTNGGAPLTNRAAAERGNGAPRQMTERERIAYASELLKR